MDLVPRFIEPTQGSVILDGKDIKEYSLRSLRDLMGIVGQESILFNDTVFNNIAFGKTNFSMEQVVEKLRPYVLGWQAYFGLAQTPRVWRELDKWLRHRLRAIQLKHWKRPKTIYRELNALGADEDVAKRVALYSRRWWRNSAMLLNSVLTIAYFDRMGVPRLS